MVKKITTIVLALLLTFAIGITFVGCQKDYEQVNVIDAYGEVMEKALKYKDFDTSKAMGGEAVFKLGARELKSTDKLIELHIKVAGNVDLSENGKPNNNFIIDILDHNNNDQKLLGVYADGDYLYIDSQEKHYKIENFRLYDILKQSKSNNMGGITNISTMMAGLFFDSAEVDGGAYIFRYKLGNVLNNIKSLMQNSGSSESLNSVAMAFKFNNWEELHNNLQDVSGRLEFHFSGDKLTSKNWYNDSKTHEFFAKIEDMKVINGLYNFDFGQLLSGKEWVTTKLLNITAQGDLLFKSAGATQAKYTWELRSNLDMFELMANGGDFNLDKDDMAHFVIKNNINDNTKEFNESRINAKSGVIFELAYDPQQLGTNNVLMAVNLKALLPNSLGKDMGVPSVALGMIPDYYGMYIDNDIIKNVLGAKSQTKNTNISNMLKHGMVSIFKNGVELNTNAMDKSSENYKLLNMISKVGDKNIDNIDFKINKLLYADMANKEYKLSENFLCVANQETAERKDFGENLGFIPSKASAPLKVDGKIEVSLSDGEKLCLNEPITEQQLNNMMGGSMDYTYIGFDNQTYTSVSPVKIIAISGLDKNLHGQKQTINVITSPPDGKNLLGFLTAIDAVMPIPTNVYQIDVILTK